MMVGLRVGRLELDELWAYVGKKQKQVTRKDGAVFGDQYTFIALASSAKAIVAYHTGKRDSGSTDLFIQDLRQRVLGLPEISSDGFKPYSARDPGRLRRSRGEWRGREDLLPQFVCHSSVYSRRSNAPLREAMQSSGDCASARGSLRRLPSYTAGSRSQER
jgi:IS1 family transposase